MYLNRIKLLAEKNKIAIRHIAIAIGMTESNLHKCVRDNRIEAGDLEKLASFLGVNINYFFIEDIDKLNDDNTINITMEHSGNGHNIASKEITLSECMKEIAHLNQIIALKDEIIDALKNNR